LPRSRKAEPAGTPARPAAIFVNEGAGSAHSERVRTTVALVRRALDADLHVTATRNPAELLAFLEERLEPYRLAVIVGGDGSLGVAYNAVAGRDITLGYIPAGFGNATAHLLKLPPHPAALAGLLARGEARPIDLVSVGGHLALFAGAGWDAVVARRYADAGARKLPGWAAAITASLPDLRRRHNVSVSADGVSIHEGPMILTVISTTPFYGRGLLINPGARPDAGHLTARVYPGPVARLIPEVARWAAQRAPAARGYVAKVVTVSSTDGRAIPVQTDGDVIGEAGEWRFEVRPAAVRIIGNWSPSGLDA
jgi:diacylglycerol kinase family enzyme